MRFPLLRVVSVLGLLLALAVLAGSSHPALAQPSHVSTASPVGRWKTIDDATGIAKSIVEIREENGTLTGTIETLFNPPVPHPICYLCSGAKKDQPLVGLQILWGFHRDGAQWSGGLVLDPETGKIYRASLSLEDGGRKLRVHGYIMVPLLGRTEYWLRAQ